MTDTEARDALADVHDVLTGMGAPCTHAGWAEGDWPCNDFIARMAQRGWALVPVDTVADAEALAALRSWCEQRGLRLDVEWDGETWSYEARTVPLEDLRGYGRGPTLAVAVRAALGDEP
jgi:hypothetical protein